MMVEHLADKPAKTTVEEWFTHIKKTRNLNPQLAEKSFELNGLPAVRVRYRNPSDGGYEMEAVYVIFRSQTFSIGFSCDRPGISLESSENYAAYLEMVKTFKVKQ